MGPQDWFWPDSDTDSWPTQVALTSEKAAAAHLQETESVTQGLGGYTPHPPVSTEGSPFGIPRESEIDDVAEYREFCETNELIRNNPNNDTGM